MPDLAHAAGIYGKTHFSRSAVEDSSPVGDTEWKRLRELRRAILRRVLGPDDELINTVLPPFYLGGWADVMTFRKEFDGMAYVTAALIGDSQSKPNEVGQYEIMICSRKDVIRGQALVSKLARYMTQDVLGQNDTMDIGHALPSRSI
jgi:hypothetical protein